MQIIPAIMPKSYEELESAIALVVSQVPIIQIDIMDGVFVENTSWPFEHGRGRGDDADFARIVSEEQGMPFWEEIDYELDLMVGSADLQFDEWVRLGAKRIVFHIESLDDAGGFLERMQDIRHLVEIGLAFNNDSGAASVIPYLSLVDFVQCMGIARVGFQGEPLDERVFDSIAAIREVVSDLPISVDGGVNMNTIERLRDAGATRFVAGSAVFGDGSIEDNIADLENIIQ